MRSICDTFLICSDLLNCLRSVGIMAKQQKVAKAASKSFSLSNFSQRPPFFAVLMYALYGQPRYLKFKRKYQQYGPCSQTVLSFLMTIDKSKYL